MGGGERGVLLNLLFKNSNEWGAPGVEAGGGRLGVGKGGVH